MTTLFPNQQQRKRWKTILLPTEHGTWGFWLEASLLGWLVVPTSLGLLLVLAGLCVLLLHQPWRITLQAIMRKQSTPRTQLAQRFLVLLSLIALCLVLMVGFGHRSFSFLLPAVFAIPITIVQQMFELQHQGRHWIAEVCGAVLFGALASCIAIVGGWDVGVSLVLWGIFAIRAIPSVFYARDRIHINHGKAPQTKLTLLMHGIGVIAAFTLSRLERTPWLVIVGASLLFARAAYGLLIDGKPIKASRLGISEMFVGGVYSLLAVLGYMTLS